ncbi:hypothetical protein FTUN_7006 [Frigoriglobus tundricola]|uniref:Uncharacterized protein n=1 Tax=Frigoriglobus tundricola TaxID=2774151 RepID=A0A6M5Z0R5_9BACT|nr:hypothetical protein FTUN_7006 [Frigoriglobus tundricola]
MRRFDWRVPPLNRYQSSGGRHRERSVPDHVFGRASRSRRRPGGARGPAAPVVVSGTGCTNCGAPAYSSGCCGSKPSILDKIKSKIGSRSHGCGCAPVADPCNTCATASYRPNLLDSLKGRWGAKKCGPSCDPCGSAVSGCATPLPPGAAPAAPPSTNTPPKEMPKEAPKTKEKTGGNVSGIPQPLPPVTGAGLTGTSPY